MYKLIEMQVGEELRKTLVRLSDNTCIPFDPANTDYQNFKKQINADEAQLQDVDGNTMTAEDAKAYVANLP